MKNISEKPKMAIAVLSICALLVVSQLYIPIPLLHVFSQYFSVSSSTAIWIGSGFSFAYAMGFLLFGPLSDHYGRRALLLPGLLFLSLITFCIAFTKEFEMMMILRVLQGFIAATFAPAALAYLSEQTPIALRPTGIACVSTGFITAGVLGQLYATSINDHFGWHAIFGVSGSLYLVLFAVAAIVLFEKKTIINTAGNSLNLTTFYRAMIHHLTNKNLLAAYLCSFVLLLNFVAMYTGLSPYLISRFNLSPVSLFNVHAFGLIGMCIAPFSGALIKRFGNKAILISGFIVTSISIFSEGVSYSIDTVIISSIFFVAGVAVSAPALIAFISTQATKARGAAIALYTFILFCGASLGPLLGNYFVPHGFFKLTLVILSITLLSLFVFAMVTNYQNRVVNVITIT